MWAFDPAVSVKKFCTEVMVVTSIVLPAMLVDRTTDMMSLFLAFAVGSAVNFIVAANESPKLSEGVCFTKGFPPTFVPG